MRIFYSFLIILTAVLLSLLPFTGAVESLLADSREDNFSVTTTTGNSANVQLFKELYDNDTSTIELLSHDADDEPIYSSYNTTTRTLEIAGLSVNTTRIVDVTYLIDAINNDAFATGINVVTYFWMIIIPLFAIGGLVWLWFQPVRERL